MINNKIRNILLVGVGGQGTILVSKILSSGLLNAGYDVKMSEIHGMAQRGGSVSTQVRFGDKVHSPIMAKGQADILVSFEMMEALRWMKYLNPNGKVIINDYQIPSAPILFGKVDYPEGVAQIISEKVNATIIKASDIADKIGNARTMNIVLFGALVKSMRLTEIDWESAIRDNVKPGMVDINILAFKAGMETVD